MFIELIKFFVNELQVILSEQIVKTIKVIILSVEGMVLSSIDKKRFLAYDISNDLSILVKFQ
ncbi:MAG: hypothetical protein ACI80S_000543 [Pseudohongiellaceae bacterium]|jgi:hypothetical protein